MVGGQHTAPLFRYDPVLLRPWMDLRVSADAAVLHATDIYWGWCYAEQGRHRAQSKASETMERHALDRRRFSKTSVALRTVAIFEVTKAAIVLLLGCGFFHIIHTNLEEVAEQVVQVLHVNPEGRLSNLFFELASHSSDRNLWVLALGTFAYASVRSIEAYGLWREREWAQWFSLLSTALYLPPELYWMLRDPRWLESAVLVTNIVIFLFMLSLRVNGRSTVVRKERGTARR